MVFAAAIMAIGTADAGRATTNPLHKVWIAGGAVRASYSVPKSMTPYMLKFYAPTIGSTSLVRAYILPSLPTRSDKWNENPGTSTSTSWTSLPIVLKLLRLMAEGRAINGPAQTPFVVRLLYAPKATCTGVGHCPAVRTSPPLTLVIKRSFTPPGVLIGQSSSSGDFATTNVAGNVEAPNTKNFPVRVKSSPGGQTVRVQYTVSCTKGTSVKSRSGGWDDTTPVDDSGTHIYAPFIDADECVVSVSASLTSGSGVIGLSVYGSKFP